MRAGKTQVLRTRESGMILYLVAAGVVLLIGVLGLAVDLVSYYTVRSEAQRAADAAALAGASVFVTSGCTGGVSGIACTSAAVHTAVENQAAAVGNANKVGGQSPGIVAATDVTFSTDTASSYNPRVTVLVQRTTANSNAMPTFFLKIFGVQTVDVSAKATAEAYNPTGGTSTSPSICLSCLKPFIAIDCDSSRIVPTTNPNGNPNCVDTGGYDSYIFNPTTKAIVNPGITPSGIIGSSITLHGETGPADYETVDLGQGTGASATANAVTSCFPGNWGCSDTLNLVTGKKTNQISNGAQTLIHEGTQCMPNTGQDTIAFSSANTPPFTITGGSANPYGLSGQTITTSDSIVTVPVYNGLSSGKGGSQTTFTIIGFMQIFITDACHSKSLDTVTANVMNVLTCQSTSGGCNGTGTSGNPGGGFVSGGGATAIPVRLVQ